MKVCRDCGLEKEAGEFYRHHAKVDGRSIYCKPCQEIRNRASKDKRTPEVRALVNRKLREWRSGQNRPAGPALMVIQQLALDWGSQAEVTRVLAERSGTTPSAVARQIFRWRTTGTMTPVAADRFACATGHHVEELWARERGAA